MNNSLIALQELRNHISKILIDLDKKIFRFGQLIRDYQMNNNDRIIEYLLNKLNCTLTELKSQSRGLKQIEKRNIILYILRYSCGETLVNLSKLVDKEHSTIISALNSLQDRIDTEPALKSKVKKMMEEVDGLYQMSIKSIQSD